MANHLESGGLAGKVHVSKATATCLAGQYELEPADGHLRDGYIRQAGVETFFIKQTEPSAACQAPTTTMGATLPGLANQNNNNNNNSINQRKKHNPTGSTTSLSRKSQQQQQQAQVAADNKATDAVQSTRMASLAITTTLPTNKAPQTMPAVEKQTSGTSRTTTTKTNQPVQADSALGAPGKRAMSLDDQTGHLGALQTQPSGILIREKTWTGSQAGGQHRRPSSSVRGTAGQSSLHPNYFSYDVNDNDDFDDVYDEEEEEEEEEEDNNEDWRPEIPFMNLNKLDLKGQVNESISAQILLTKETDVPGATCEASANLGPPQPTTQSDNFLTVPGERSSRSMSSLLRNSFRRERTSSGSASLRRPVLVAGTPEPPALEQDEAQLRHAQSVPSKREPNELMVETTRAPVTGQTATCKPGGGQLDALRRTYYRSFNIKSRNKSNKRPPINLASSFSQGASTPSQTKRLVNRFTFGQRHRTSRDPLPMADEAVDELAKQPVGIELERVEVQSTTTGDNQQPRRKSSLVRIKIIEDSQENSKPAESFQSDHQTDQSIIVSCPTSGGGRTMSSTSPANANNRRRRQHSAAKNSLPSTGTSGYVILFSRLFCNKLRQRSACCGRLRSGSSGSVTPVVARPTAHRRPVGANKRRRAAANRTSPATAACNQQAAQGRAGRSSIDSSTFTGGGDSSIEVEISRRMMKEHINWFLLTFKSKALEEAYCQIRYTTSKSNIVYIFVTWLLMALVGLLSLPDLWHTVKVILVATVPLSAFACFYMSDSILYNRYMNYKLKEASQSNSNQLERRRSSAKKRGSSIRRKEPGGHEKRLDSTASSTAVSSFNSSVNNNHHKVAPLVHRVAKFWSKLDRIPMIWNIFIFTFNLIMTVAFLNINTFECNPIESFGSLYGSKRTPLVELGKQERQQVVESSPRVFTCIHQENLTFSVILIMIEMGSFFRSSYLRKVILLTSMMSSFIVYFYTLDTRLPEELPWLSELVSLMRAGASSEQSGQPHKKSIDWTMFNVAHDHSVCPMATFHGVSHSSDRANLSSLLQYNYLSPYTLASISQCDPNLIEKSCVIIVIMFIGLVYVCRSTERISRLDFLWKLQASKELQDMRALRHYNTQLLENILPDHVAAHFLQDERDSEELYAKSYPCVAVLFASIPNFSSFYSEDINNGMECIRLLNEIIFDFDQLLESDQFRSIEKVKTISSTYLAACGLNPRDQSLPPSYHLSTCCDFAFAMKQALNEVNIHSFNNFVMRIGISHGPLVGGVIGAKKPVFDIWGDTVNEASRMDSTGTLDMIQVPKRSAVILASEGFLVQCRGVIQVKGKGEMETYYVIEKSSPVRTHQRQPAQQAQTAGREPSPQVAAKPEEPILVPGDKKVDVGVAKAKVAQLEPAVSKPAPEQPPEIIQTKPDGAEKETKEAVNATDDKQVDTTNPEATQRETTEPPKTKTFNMQNRRLNRHARTAQSLKDPSTRRNRRQDRLGIVQKDGQDLELGELDASDRLKASSWRLPFYNLSSNRDSACRLRSASPLDLRPMDNLLTTPGSSNGAQDAQAGAAGNEQENSLTAVVFNMVQMRKNYESLGAKFGGAASAGCPSGGQAGAGSERQHHHRQHHHQASNGNDLSSEAAKLVTDTINDPTSSLVPAAVALNSNRMQKYSSLIARQPKSSSANLNRKSSKNRASLFRRRANYHRAGTSAVSDYGPTEESIRENE